MVAAAIAFDLWTLRAERTPVPYENDLSIHTAMVQYAAQRISAGHLPWTGWFANIGLGSPQFLHYQSLPAVLTGLVAQVISPQSAVSWSTYLLLGIWPLSVYISARLFSLRPWEAAWAAAASPFLSTAFSSGYEQRAYIFLGYGLWTQLFAMWSLPIAWGLTWRAITDHRRHLAAAVLVALTICFHFETGYLALAALDRLPVRFATRPSTKTALRFIGRCCSARNVCLGMGSPVRFAAVVRCEHRARRNRRTKRVMACPRCSTGS